MQKYRAFEHGVNSLLLLEHLAQVPCNGRELITYTGPRAQRTICVMIRWLRRPWEATKISSGEKGRHGYIYFRSVTFVLAWWMDVWEAKREGKLIRSLLESHIQNNDPEGLRARRDSGVVQNGNIVGENQAHFANVCFCNSLLRLSRLFQDSLTVCGL